jgi:hypothetical protein
LIELATFAMMAARADSAADSQTGLKKEGVLREAEWLYDHYVDITMNSVLRTEWKEQAYGE